MGGDWFQRLIIVSILSGGLVYQYRIMNSLEDLVLITRQCKQEMNTEKNR